MKVVHLSEGPLSGGPIRLAQVQKLGGLDARLLSVTQWQNDQRFYPHDLVAADDPRAVADVLAAADVVHCHNHYRDSELFQVLPWAWDLVRGKPLVIHFHTPRGAELDPGLQEPAAIRLVPAQYHVRCYPECRPVPNAVPIDDAYHRPLGLENDPPIVAFTPSDCGAGDWYEKGCRETLAVLGRGFRYRFTTESPWHEAMLLRQACDVAIDEVVTGSYHLCSLEALSQGLATVAGLDARTIDALEAVTGTREHPWVVATLETLEERLRTLVEDHAYRADRRRAARAYMERYWSPRALARVYEGIYQEALVGPRPRRDLEPRRRRPPRWRLQPAQGF